MTEMREEKWPKWDVKRLNIAIIGTDGKSFRKFAWIKTGSGGIYCFISDLVGSGSKLSYHANGDLYHITTLSPPIKKQLTAQGQLPPRRPPLKYPPIANIKGFVPFFAGGIGWHEYLRDFPFERVDDAVYVDVRRHNGVSFNLGLLEPNAFQSFNLRGFHNPRIHIITKTNPWITIWTYEPPPTLQPTWMSEKKVIRCKQCGNPLNITREPSNPRKMQHAHCDICGFNITTQICANCGKGVLVQIYDKKDPSSNVEPRRIVTREECRGEDGFSSGCGWKNDIVRTDGTS